MQKRSGLRLWRFRRCAPGAAPPGRTGLGRLSADLHRVITRTALLTLACVSRGGRRGGLRGPCRRPGGVLGAVRHPRRHRLPSRLPSPPLGTFGAEFVEGDDAPGAGDHRDWSSGPADRARTRRGTAAGASRASEPRRVHPAPVSRRMYGPRPAVSSGFDACARARREAWAATPGDGGPPNQHTDWPTQLTLRSVPEKEPTSWWTGEIGATGGDFQRYRLPPVAGVLVDVRRDSGRECPGFNAGRPDAGGELGVRRSEFVSGPNPGGPRTDEGPRWQARGVRLPGVFRVGTVGYEAFTGRTGTPRRSAHWRRPW